MSPSLALWWRLARPFSLTASVVPVLVGSAVALADGSLRAADLVVAMLVSSVLIQIATNMFNEYYDYRKGLDTRESVGIAGVIVQGSMRAEGVFAAGAACFALAFLIGLYIVARSDGSVFAVGVVSALAGYLYTGGPAPIAYTPLGELEVFIFMGPVIVGLAYFVQALRLTPSALWASLPVGCLVAAILLANNLRDQEADRLAGRRTLPLVLGRSGGRLVYVGLLASAYLTTVLAVGALWLPPTALGVLITAPLVAPLIRLYRRTSEAAALDRGVRGSAILHARFGALLAAGIALGPLIAWAPPAFDS